MLGSIFRLRHMQVVGKPSHPDSRPVRTHRARLRQWGQPYSHPAYPLIEGIIAALESLPKPYQIRVGVGKT